MSMSDPALKSKKFLAYLIAELSWKALAGLVLFWGKDSMPGMVFGVLIAIVIVAGFVEVGYILGTVSLDKYIKVAEIAVGAGHEVAVGHLQAKPKADKPPTQSLPAPQTPESKTSATDPAPGIPDKPATPTGDTPK